MFRCFGHLASSIANDVCSARCNCLDELVFYNSCYQKGYVEPFPFFRFRFLMLENEAFFMTQLT